MATKLRTDSLAAGAFGVRDAGLTDHVGLSNVTLDHAQRHGYPLVAYAPLAGGRVVEDPTIQAIA